MRMTGIFRLLALIGISLGAAALFVGCDVIADFFDDSPRPVVVDLTDGGPFREPIVRIPMLGDSYIREDGITVNKGSLGRGFVKIQGEADAELIVIINCHSPMPPDVFSLDASGEWRVFPLTRGDGVYNIQVLQLYGDQVFTLLFDHDVHLSLYNDMYPFLYPSKYVDFTDSTEAVAIASRLAGSAVNELEIVRRIYEFVTTNIRFDEEFAAEVHAGMVAQHTPNADETLRSGKGVCFDYAALMAVMLRSQGIPTRLEIGYVLGIFHAWVAVYIPGVDWGLAAHPLGDGFGLLDPTTTAANNATGFMNPLINADEFQKLFVR